MAILENPIPIVPRMSLQTPTLSSRTGAMYAKSLTNGTSKWVKREIDDAYPRTDVDMKSSTQDFNNRARASINLSQKNKTPKSRNI